MNPEVFTKCILPNPELQSYVRCFAFRKFNTGENLFPKQIIAEHEVLLNFFVHCKEFAFERLDESHDSGVFVYNNSAGCRFTGIQTSTKGSVIFKGEIAILTIHFTPVGFFNIFRIRPKEILNKYGDAESILSTEIRLVHEEIQEKNTIHQMIGVLQRYLIKKLTSTRNRYINPAIEAASSLILQKNGICSITQLAKDYNLTIQTLETQFSEQVGIDPKSFCCTVRFNTAVKMKLYHPSMNWTDISHACGFYDQMHLIKEFKKFTLLTPKAFMKLVQPPVENFLSV